MKNNDFKDFDISNFIELTEDQLRFEVNGGWGHHSSSSSSSSSSSRSNSSSSRGSSSSGSRGSSSTSTSKQSSSSTSTATGSSGSGRSNASQKSGSREVANTNHAVANAKPGDTITRNNGTRVTLTQGDINYAKAHDNTPAATITPSNSKQATTTTNSSSKSTGSSGASSSSGSSSFSAYGSNEVSSNKSNANSIISTNGDNTDNQYNNIETINVINNITENSDNNSKPVMVNGKQKTKKEISFPSNNDGKNNKGSKVYFLYTYKQNSYYDQKLLRNEWSSICDDVKYLRNNGITVDVDLAATYEDIQKAIKDDDSVMVVISGHGYKDCGIQTTERRKFQPSDVPVQGEIGENLKTVIMENCYQEGSSFFNRHDNGNSWRKAFGKDIDFIGWIGSTTTFETNQFNGTGCFDRQKGSLREKIKAAFNIED